MVTTQSMYSDYMIIHEVFVYSGDDGAADGDDPVYAQC